MSISVVATNDSSKVTSGGASIKDQLERIKAGGVVVLSDTGREIITQAVETDPSYNNIKGDARDARTEGIVENDVITDPDAVKKSKFRCNLAIYQWIIILQSGC